MDFGRKKKTKFDEKLIDVSIKLIKANKLLPSKKLLVSSLRFNEGGARKEKFEEPTTNVFVWRLEPSPFRSRARVQHLWISKSIYYVNDDISNQIGRRKMEKLNPNTYVVISHYRLTFCWIFPSHWFYLYWNSGGIDLSAIARSMGKKRKKLFDKKIYFSFFTREEKIRKSLQMKHVCSLKSIRTKWIYIAAKYLSSSISTFWAYSQRSRC